jgi:hypothetical protein
VHFAQVQRYGGFQNIEIRRAGPQLASHCGIYVFDHVRSRRLHARQQIAKAEGAQAARFQRVVFFIFLKQTQADGTQQL